MSSLPEDKKVEAITSAAKNLTSEQKEAVVAVLTPPSPKTNDYIWLIVIVAFSIILVGIVTAMAADRQEREVFPQRAQRHF